MNMLSVVAQCTPFSDMNQSPRNMYQCQMGKQTMGSPMFAYNERCDNKSYRILTPQVCMCVPVCAYREHDWQGAYVRACVHV